MNKFLAKFPNSMQNTDLVTVVVCDSKTGGVSGCTGITFATNM